jgi:hypothetical protein
MAGILLKAIIVWLAMLVLAMLNGIVRDMLLAPAFGITIAQPASGIILSILIFAVSYYSLAFIGASRVREYLGVGLFWVCLTLVFEYLFAHYVLGMSWRQVNQIFNIQQGNLFSLALLVSATGPLLAAKVAGKL